MGKTERVSIPGKIIKSHLPIFQSDVPLTLMDCMALYSFNLIGMKSMPVLFLSETVPLNFTLIPSACHRGKGKRTSPLWGGATAAMRISHSVSSQAKEKKKSTFSYCCPLHSANFQGEFSTWWVLWASVMLQWEREPQRKWAGKAEEWVRGG